MANVEELSPIILAALERKVAGVVDQVGTVWAEEAQRRNPAKDHGTIYYMAGGLHVPLIPYILSEGARPHRIKPRNADRLRFYWARVGRRVAFASVWHPGYKGTGYLWAAWRAMEHRVPTGRHLRAW